MEDVKVIVKGMRYALAGTGLILLTSTIFLSTKSKQKTVLRAYYFGGWTLSRVNWCHYYICFGQFQSIIYLVSPIVLYQWYLDVLHLLIL